MFQEMLFESRVVLLFFIIIGPATSDWPNDRGAGLT